MSGALPGRDESLPSSVVTLPSVRRRLLRGSTWIFAGKMVTLPLGFLISSLLARLLTPAEFGAYFATFTLVYAGSILAQFGMDRAAVRFVATALATGRTGDARRVIRTVFTVGSLTSVVVALALVFGVGTWLARTVFDSAVMETVIPVAAAWLVVTALKSLMVETFRAFQQFGIATVLDSLAADIITASTFAVLLAAGAKPSVRDVVAFSVAAAALVALVAAALLRRRTRALPRDGHVSRREIFGMAWPVLVTDTAIYVLGTGWDVLVLGAFRPLSEVALYGAASRLMGLAVTPSRTLQGVVPPIIAELHAQGRNRELEWNMRAAATFTGLPTALALGAFLVGGSWILGLLFGSFYSQAATILVILTAGRVVAVWTGPCGLVLTITGHQRTMMYLTLATSSVSIVAGIAAAARYGAIGVAVATSTTGALQNVLQLVLAQRFVGVSTRALLSPRALVRFIRERDSLGAEDRGDVEPPATPM